MPEKIHDIMTVILCGGLGKRMFPITTDKSLLEFNGIPLIRHQINVASTAGLHQFTVVTNQFNHALIKSALQPVKGVTINYVMQKKPTGMAGAVLSASHFISGKTFILLSSNDIFNKPFYESVIKAFKDNNSYAAYIAATRVHDYFPGGYLVTNSKNEIKQIIEKPGLGNEPSSLVNIVLHLHTQPSIILDYIRSVTSVVDDVYEKALNKMIVDAYKLKAVIFEAPWQSIKYPWHILNAMDYFLTQLKGKISKNALISDRAYIDSNVVIEDNVRVFEGAIIRGPSYISKNCVIGNNAMVRNSTIGNGSVIGFSTEIKHSHVGNNCWFHSNYIGDSVIGDNCSFGAGVIIANFRLDEKNIRVNINGKLIKTGYDKLGAFVGNDTRIGINSSIMPGIKIGINSFIGPNICLNQDIEKNSAIFAESRNLILRRNCIRTKNIKRKIMLQKLNK